MYGNNGYNMFSNQYGNNASMQAHKFDKTIQQYVKALKIEKREMAGIQIEIPESSYNYIQKNFEDFLTNSRPDEKVTLLENTILKRKALKKKD